MISKPERNYIILRNVLWHRVGALWHHFVCVQQFQHPVIFLFHTSRHRVERILHNCLTGRFVVVVVLVAKLCLTLCDPMDCSPPGPSVHGDSPGKNTGVSCHALLYGIFLTQGSNPHLLVSRTGRRVLDH